MSIIKIDLEGVKGNKDFTTDSVERVKNGGVYKNLTIIDASYIKLFGDEKQRAIKLTVETKAGQRAYVEPLVITELKYGTKEYVEGRNIKLLKALMVMLNITELITEEVEGKNYEIATSLIGKTISLKLLKKLDVRKEEWLDDNSKFIEKISFEIKEIYDGAGFTMSEINNGTENPEKIEKDKKIDYSENVIKTKRYKKEIEGKGGDTKTSNGKEEIESDGEEVPF